MLEAETHGHIPRQEFLEREREKALKGHTSLFDWRNSSVGRAFIYQAPNKLDVVAWACDASIQHLGGRGRRIRSSKAFLATRGFQGQPGVQEVVSRTQKTSQAVIALTFNPST